jgi:hypothetical protein
MTAPGVSTFDLPTPRRPALADVGGGEKIDDAENPPDPQTMPYATEYNTFAHLLAAYGRIVSSVKLSIEGGAAPFISGIAALGSNVTLATFRVDRDGPGDVRITWPPRTLPTPTTAPTATINEDGPFSIAAFAIAGGVRVKTYRGNAPTDAAFTVEVC